MNGAEGLRPAGPVFDGGAWELVDWRCCEEEARRLRRGIFKAVKDGGLAGAGGLQQLMLRSGPLQEAAAVFLRVGEDLLAVAAMESPDIEKALEPEAGLATWIEQLPPAEKDGLLLKAAQGEAMGVQATLLRRFRSENPGGGPGLVAGQPVISGGPPLSSGISGSVPWRRNRRQRPSLRADPTTWGIWPTARLRGIPGVHHAHRA
ncbi:MAG: hypothetical protein ACM3ML_09130 [Micromonosporaceae bacterium]